MQDLIPEYVKYSRILGIYTIAIRIRQYSWGTRELLRNINANIKKLNNKVKKIKKKNLLTDIGEINTTSNLLASELRKWMYYLKVIYFHNSTILYLHLKILLKLYSRIEGIKKKNAKLKKRTKEKHKKHILEHKERILKNEIKVLAKVDKKLINSLISFKKGFNKALRQGFSFKTLTFLPVRRISQKMKIKARKIKETENKRKQAMQKLNIERNVKKVANLIEKEIEAVEKDVLYNRQLLKKLRGKKKYIENIIRHLGKKLLRMKVDRENINKILIPINQPYIKLDKTIKTDLEKMFYTGLRQLNMSLRKSKPLKKAG